MENNTSELKIFFNKNYDVYGQSYLIYCKDGGRYLSSKKSSFRIMDKRNSTEDELSNVEAYATSRGFYKILELQRKENSEELSIQWFSTVIPGDMKEVLNDSMVEIVNICRRGINHDPYVIHFYCMMRSLLSLI